MTNASNAHQRQGLVEFQRQIFAQIAAFQQRGDERLCLRADAGSIAWAMDANDIVHVTQLPRNIPLIPAAPSYVRGLLQSDGEVYTPTPVHKSNRVLMLHPSLMANTALLVDKTYSLSAIESFHVDPDTSPAPLGTTVM
jgi:chemotaxis signal transduction protein